MDAALVFRNGETGGLGPGEASILIPADIFYRATTLILAHNGKRARLDGNTYYCRVCEKSYYVYGEGWGDMWRCPFCAHRLRRRSRSANTDHHARRIGYRRVEAGGEAP